MKTYCETVKHASMDYDIPIHIVDNIYWKVNGDITAFFDELEYYINNRPNE